MKRPMRIFAIAVLLASVSCQVAVRPAISPPHDKQKAHRECLDRCKGLKGHDRAECNKECNRRYQ
ncbi:MAG: hypothetical protein N2316_07860 [Spirochaetes bacterium]|nr:hypothetical protein [Spirochaetota bacterium]